MNKYKCTLHILIIVMEKINENQGHYYWCTEFILILAQKQYDR